jgi:hypothetical protein
MTASNLLAKAIHVFLEMQGIELLQGNVWGHRKDPDEYLNVEDATIEEIRSLAASGASMDDVTDKIQQKTRLNTDLQTIRPLLFLIKK